MIRSALALRLPRKASGSAPEAFCIEAGRRRGLPLAAALLAALFAGCAPPSGTVPNVLLISVDTLRADRLGCYGAAAVETPAIDALARQGVRFENAFTPVPLTLPAHWTLHTGLEPWRHGVVDNGLTADLAPGLTLAEKLGGAGFETAAFVSAFVLHSTFGLDRGFARYDDGPAADAALDQVLHATAPADERVGRALRWLSRRPRMGEPGSRPFFLWLHLFDPHAPYAPPAEFRARYRERPYDGEIAFVDQQIARLLAGLERLGLAGRTLVVLTSDHGESLGEHGEQTHGVLLYDATLRVPLIFRLPADTVRRDSVLQDSVRRDTVRQDAVTLADVAPTVLALAGLESETDGRDLFGPAASGEKPRLLGAISEGPRRRFGWASISAVRAENWKYIAAPEAELYDWQSDPHELRDLRGEQTEPADRLARAARAIERELEARLAARQGGGRDDAAGSAEVRAGLAALGYVGAAAADRRGSPADPNEAISALGELDRAYQLFAEGRFEPAESALRSLLERPDFPAAPALEGLARLARLRGDRPAAEEAYARLLAADPESVSALAQLVLLARERGAPEAALGSARRLVELAPADGGASRLLAETLAAAGDPAAAEEEWRRGLAAAPRAGWLRLSYARFLARAERREQARAVLQPLLAAEDLPGELRQAALELAAPLGVSDAPGG